MPIIQPGRADVHINGPLTNISVAWTQDQDLFIADKVFPVVSVKKQSDLYFIVDPDRVMARDVMTERAPATESDGTTFNYATDPYYCRKYSLHHDIPDEVRDNADTPLDVDSDTTTLLTESAWIRRENLWVSTYFTQTNPGDVWTFSVTGVAAGSETAAVNFNPTSSSNNKVVYWDDARSTPIEDVRRAKRWVQQRTGKRPNKLTLQQTVYDALLDHPDIVGRIDRGQTTGAAMANRRTMAELFEVDEVLVAGATRNTAEKGVTPANMQFIAGKNAMLSYAPSAPGLMKASAGYTFDWNNGRSRGIRSFRMELKDADRIEYTDYIAHKKVDGQLGYFFNGIVAN